MVRALVGALLPVGEGRRPVALAGARCWPAGERDPACRGARARADPGGGPLPAGRASWPRERSCHGAAGRCRREHRGPGASWWCSWRVRSWRCPTARRGPWRSPAWAARARRRWPASWPRWWTVPAGRSSRCVRRLPPATAPPPPQGRLSAEGYLDDSFDPGRCAGWCSTPCPPAAPPSRRVLRPGGRPTGAGRTPSRCRRAPWCSSRDRSSWSPSSPTGGTWRCCWSPTRRASWSVRLSGTPTSGHLSRCVSSTCAGTSRRSRCTRNVTTPGRTPTWSSRWRTRHSRADPRLTLIGSHGRHEAPTLAVRGPRRRQRRSATTCRTGGACCSTTCPSGSATGPRSRWSAPTARARRRCCGSSPATSTRTRAR